jgi:hypothetical protein
MQEERVPKTCLDTSDTNTDCTTSFINCWTTGFESASAFFAFSGTHAPPPTFVFLFPIRIFFFESRTALKVAMAANPGKETIGAHANCANAPNKSMADGFVLFVLLLAPVVMRDFFVRVRVRVCFEVRRKF